MNKITLIFIATGILLSISVFSVLAETNDISSLQELIAKLKEQIEELKAQIASLTRTKLEIKETAKEIKETLRLTRQLWYGMENDDVELLQEVLATDPEIYPEGLVTGYYGSLTFNAVKRFQKKVGFEQVGRVGPKTLSKINEILTEGAGESGKVPPGLLIAPGIIKKLGFTPEPFSGQELPPGIEKKLDTTTSPVEGVTPVTEGVYFQLGF